MEPAHEHWLVRAAQKAGLAGAAAIQLQSKAPVEEAWTTVARACKLTDRELATKVAPQVGMNPAEFGTAEERITKLLPEAVARQFRVFPLRTQQNQLIAATSDPVNLAAEQAIAFCAGRRVGFELAAPSQVEEAIRSTYAPDRLAEQLLTAARGELTDAIRLVQTTQPESITAKEIEAAPVVRLTNLIFCTTRSPQERAMSTSNPKRGAAWCEFASMA